jgi:hypothetical protein
MTIEITRTSGGTFQACPVGNRQREDEPNVIESRATYRGARWSFVARFKDVDEARQALLEIGKQADSSESGTK